MKSRSPLPSPSAGKAVTATGTVWTFCFHNGKLVQKKHICPITWSPKETNRYERAGYTTRRKDCSDA